jgi:hypothetical protein
VPAETVDHGTLHTVDNSAPPTHAKAITALLHVCGVVVSGAADGCVAFSALSDAGAVSHIQRVYSAREAAAVHLAAVGSSVRQRGGEGGRRSRELIRTSVAA